MDTESLMSQLNEMLASLDERSLDERSQHWPFKKKAKLGPSGAKKYGPPPGGGRSVKKTDDWVCKKKGKYVQLCKGPDGQKKIVRIDPGYKKAYNAAYRKWQAKKGKSKSKAKK